jgi:hypothetical protein
MRAKATRARPVVLIQDFHFAFLPHLIRERMRLLRRTVQDNNVYRWAGRMLMDAARSRQRQFLRARAPTHRRRPGPYAVCDRVVVSDSPLHPVSADPREVCVRSARCVPCGAHRPCSPATGMCAFRRPVAPGVERKAWGIESCSRPRDSSRNAMTKLIGDAAAVPRACASIHPASAPPHRAFRQR